MYKITIHLDAKNPIPQIGDKFEIISIEDGEYSSKIPYVIATLQPVEDKVIDPENIYLVKEAPGKYRVVTPVEKSFTFFQEDDVAPI